MREIFKAKIEGTWQTKPLGPAGLRVDLLQVRKGKRGALYVCFPVLIPGLPLSYDAPFAAILASASKLNLLSWRDARDMRLPQLSFWAKGVGDLLTEGLVDQTVAEQVLDYLYAHMNQRLNK